MTAGVVCSLATPDPMVSRTALGRTGVAGAVQLILEHFIGPEGSLVWGRHDTIIGQDRSCHGRCSRKVVGTI